MGIAVGVRRGSGRLGSGGGGGSDIEALPFAWRDPLVLVRVDRLEDLLEPGGGACCSSI